MKNYFKFATSKKLPARKKTITFFNDLISFDKNYSDLYWSHYTSWQKAFILLIKILGVSFLLLGVLLPTVLTALWFKCCGNNDISYVVYITVIIGYTLSLFIGFKLFLFFVKYYDVIKCKYDKQVYEIKYKTTIGGSEFEEFSDYEIHQYLVLDIFNKHNKIINSDLLAELIKLIERDRDDIPKPETIKIWQIMLRVATLILPFITSFFAIIISLKLDKHEVTWLEFRSLMLLLILCIFILFGGIFAVISLINTHRLLFYKDKHNVTLKILNDFHLDKI